MTDLGHIYDSWGSVTHPDRVSDIDPILNQAGFMDKDFERIRQNPRLAYEMLMVIQPEDTASVPSWYVSPEQQLKRAREIWPNAILPNPPKGFIRRTDTEVLLLHVPDVFDSLWEKIEAPTGYIKLRRSHVESDKQSLHLSSRKVEFTDPIWLAFDPEHGRGESPSSFEFDYSVAASEVFSALIQFPEWPLSWRNGASSPCLAGYEIYWEDSWWSSPCVEGWDELDGYRVLELTLHPRHAEWQNISSPSVRQFWY